MSPAAACLATLVVVPAATGALLLIVGRGADRLARPTALVATLAAVALGLTVAVTRPSVTAPFLGIVPGGDLGFANLLGEAGEHIAQSQRLRIVGDIAGQGLGQ